MRTSLGVALIAGLVSQHPEVRLQDRWSEADAAVVRLAPADFPELPGLIVESLEKRGCSIPQPTDSTSRANVVHGEFLAAGSSAWAVLCSVERVSRVLVFDSEEQLVAELNETADRSYLQGAGPEGIVYSRLLATATPAHMRRHHEESGEPAETLPSLTHDGIEDVFLEKASSIFYFTGNEWILMPGAD